MSATSLAFSNVSILDPPPSSIPFGVDCLLLQPSSFLFTMYTITILLLLLPLYILVLYRSLQRWRQQRSSSRAASSSHSDSFSCHLVAMELCYICGSILCCCGIYSSNVLMLLAWYYPYSFSWFGKIFFHDLTCLEHYLAVVYPISYLSLKSERGIRLRNAVIGCIWLLCFGLTHAMTIRNSFSIINISLLGLSIVIISFCSLSVLFVLVRPGPGEPGRDRVRLHQSKQKAFYTIVAILGVLLLRCVWNLVWTGSDALHLNSVDKCVGLMCEIWVNLSSSLVLPLLFLQRDGFLACTKNVK